MSMPKQRGKWAAGILLILLLICGGYLSFAKITKESLWGDEFWAVYLATGRGNMAFDLPRGVFMEHPPATNFAGAPAIWHILTGLQSTPHPPVYHLALRLWIDLFGDSDLATRSLSAVCGLVGGIVLFVLVKRQFGTAAGLSALALMMFAPTQIDFRQQARPYTLLVLLGLLLCAVILSIERKGISRGRICGLFAAVLGLTLTHYFALGAVLAVLIYSTIRFRGRQRRLTIWSIVAAIALAAVVWGPIAWASRNQIIIGPNYGMNAAVSRWHALLNVAEKLVVNSKSDLMMGAIFAVVIVTPLFRLRNPAILFWWLWVICTIGMVATIDFARGSVLMNLDRYIFLAAPGIFALVCSWATLRFGWMIVAAITLAAIDFGIGRGQAGPDFSQSTREVAKVVNQTIGPRDGVIIVGHFPSDPAFRYIVLAHYGGDWKNPVAFLAETASPELSAQMRETNKVWVVAYDPDDIRMLPGWRITQYRGIAAGYDLFCAAPR